jgi:Cu/Ag efflux protein CusF
MLRLISTVGTMMLTVSAFACSHMPSAIVKKIDLEKKIVVVAAAEKSDLEKKAVVEASEKTHTFTTGDKTKFEVNGKEAKFADLKDGDKVSIDYESTTDVVKISVTRES